MITLTWASSWHSSSYSVSCRLCHRSTEGESYRGNYEGWGGGVVTGVGGGVG